MKKLYLFLVALLCTTGAWAGAGFWSEKAVKSLVLSVDEKANTYQWNSTGVNAVDLGEISSPLSITSYEVNVWKDGGNICTSKMQYRVYKTTETAGDWQDIDGTWKSDNGNNQVWGTSENANKDVTPKAPGSYKLEMQFISTGNESSSSGCGTTFTLNNGGKYYVLNFTIPTPIVPYVLFGEDVPSEVEAGTEIALSATSANFEGDVTYAYSVKVPDGTDFVAIEGTTYTPSTVGTYTLKVVATSGDQLAEKEQTLTVKAAAIDIDIRVQIPTGLTSWVYATAPYLYFWNGDDISDTWVAMTDEGDNWYKGTIHAASINFIVVNGNSWDALGSSAPRQSVDVKGVTESGCYILVDNGSNNKNVSTTDCPSNEPSVAFDGVATAVKCGDVITLSATAKNFTSDVTLAYSVKVPGSDEFVAIEGTTYTPSTVGTYTLKVEASAGEKKAEKTMEITATIDCYLAGTGIEGLDWQDNKMPMYGNTITLSNVAANTKISFKVVYQGDWLGIAAVDTDNSSDGVEGEDNIEITTSEACDVTITYDPESKKIVVTGKFGGVVTITSYTVVGYEALMGSEWKVDDTANDMTKAEDGDVWTLVKKDVELAVGTYNYQAVANHAWDVKKYPSQGTNSIEIKTAGVYTITFTLKPEAASDNLTAEAVITITSYTIAGDEALMGSKWKEDDTANDMTKAEDGDVWTLVKKNVALAAQTYEYKAVANHTWGTLDFPTSNTNQQVTVEEAGYYTVTFTLVQETSLECELEKTGDFEYKYSVMYGIEGSNEAWTSVVLAQVDATTEWKSAEIALPDDISNYKCYVAYNNGTGEPAFVQDKSATVALSSVGGENGAKGTFRIYSDSSDSNWFLAFAKTSSTPTGLTENSACSVFAQDGTIYADGNDLRIYTLTGIEVTAQNGALNGIYVVKTNGKILKVSVR